MVFIESINGHDTISVDGDKIQKNIESHLKDDKWVTLEKENGATEILTENDIPNSQHLVSIDNNTTFSTEEEQWAEKFYHVKSATVTNKAKGG